MFERILVPLDGSELAKQVFGCVEDLARAFSPTIVIAGVCEPHESEREQACRDYIGLEAQRLQQNTPSTLKLEKAVLMGKPAELILEYAEKNDIGLIVISSHGRSGIQPWSLGSTANKVLHKVGVPLIMVRAARPGTAPTPSIFKKILVPLDGSEKGESILPYVAEIHRRIASAVTLLRVVEPGKHVRSMGGLDYVRFEDRDMETTKAQARGYLKKAAAGLGEGVTTEVLVGDSAEEIVKYAAGTGCTLVAMPSHGHSGIESWLYGSVTYKVLQAGKEAVMLVPSGK